MKDYKVITTDDGRFQVYRWNKVSKQFELHGRTYPTQELAEKVARQEQEMYDEEQSMYNKENQ